MDSVIRAPRAGMTRTKLGSRAGTAPVPQQTAGESELSPAQTELQAKQDAVASIRADVERALRLELEVHALQLFETRKEEGYQAGLADGRDAAAEALRAAEARMRSAFDQAVAGLVAAQKAWHAKLEQDVGEIAFAAICRIVGQKAISREFVEACVEQACASLRGDAAAKVRLNPSDKSLIVSRLPVIEQSQNLHLELIADPSVASGGCLLEASSGGYDASLATQLTRLYAVLTAKRIEAVD